MFKQSYINIFKNASGNVTLAYSPCNDNVLNDSIDLDFLSINHEDLVYIAESLLDLENKLEQERMNER